MFEAKNQNCNQYSILCIVLLKLLGRVYQYGHVTIHNQQCYCIQQCEESKHIVDQMIRPCGSTPSQDGICHYSTRKSSLGGKETKVEKTS